MLHLRHWSSGDMSALEFERTKLAVVRNPFPTNTPPPDQKKEERWHNVWHME